MTNDDKGKIIRFLFDYFHNEDIVMLCLVEFPEIQKNLRSGMSKRQNPSFRAQREISCKTQAMPEISPPSGRRKD